MAQQFQLRGASLEDLTREAAETYGAAARIVRAERVLDGGLGGFLGRRHIEVTVLVPDDDEPVVALAPAVPHALTARTGIAALLEEAETAEDALHTAARPRGGRTPGGPAEGPAHGAPPRAVSTEATDFEALLQRLRREVDAGDVPAPLSAPGDLVLVLGVGGAARAVAQSMAEHAGPADQQGPAEHPRQGARWELYGAGAVVLADRPHLAGRWDAVTARAAAVEAGRAALVACSLGTVADGLPHLEGAAELAADQVWLVVDARHKPEDTADWTDRVRGALPVDALAVLGAGETRTAHTVNRLGLPLGWVDGSPAPRTVL
ncbi:hypothetical protein SA2016_0745 [Sinomonas atrocyanea]|uniref:Uncharacterized protein n=1 Tax=Sinomonas atrocyanea TaxID=37927 RepID=A0A126ZYG0_9MICC|nr:hypothetical protein [Sinomonas atrocyanea]AMM31435.1 hypothetical protein SA2016_0745 [Sinomonas atrocyanea]GEB63720.1 hypothetical protein SAT01_11680 [Sinomonas atrocyanea]GGG63918.1 hypothetical protein GCM10007172_14060 [Sinomonas atrocyanea]